MRNYHSHTYLCRHASGRPIDYLNKAVELGFTHYGISDHAPMPNLEVLGSIRMLDSEYAIYLDDLLEAKTILKNKIVIHQGLEVEYFNFYHERYEHFLQEMDYLILGQHYIILKDGSYLSTYRLTSLEHIIIYRDTLMEALKSGYFNLLCHIGLCFYNIKNPTKEMLEALRPVIKLAKALDIPIEVNANGLRKALRVNKTFSYENVLYPRKDVFKMVQEEEAKVIIQSDCHSTEDMYDWAILEARKFVEELKLSEIHELKMNYYK